MLVQSIITAVATLLSTSVLGEENCYSELGKGLCTRSMECLDSHPILETCRRGQICCPMALISSDRKMAAINAHRVKIRRPMISMRNPVRSSMRRKRRPLIKYSHVNNRLPTSYYMSIPLSNQNKYSNFQTYNKQPEMKPLSYYYSNHGSMLDYTPEESPNLYLDTLDETKPNDLIELYGDVSVDLGVGKPFSNDQPMYPDEPDLVTDSNLFNVMFKPKKHMQKPRRSAKFKCDEYKKISTETVAELTKFGVVQKKVDKCSLASMNSSNHFGLAKKAEFPHSVALGYEDDDNTLWECSGSLISDNYVLTAAHCIDTPYGKPVKIEMGKININESTSKELRISDILIHPLYNATGRYNDIALLKLAKRVKFSDSRRPACLQTGRYYGMDAIGTYWETEQLKSEINDLKLNDCIDDEISSEENSTVVTYTVKLKKSRYTILDDNECGVPQDIQDSLLCTSTYLPGSICTSDGRGGALQVKHGSNKCMYSIIGISSMKSCEEPTMSIYTRVAHFIPWIESIVWN